MPGIELSGPTPKEAFGGASAAPTFGGGVSNAGMKALEGCATSRGIADGDCQVDLFQRVKIEC
jgi:hypothetical protein